MITIEQERYLVSGKDFHLASCSVNMQLILIMQLCILLYLPLHYSWCCDFINISLLLNISMLQSPISYSLVLLCIIFSIHAGT